MIAQSQISKLSNRLLKELGGRRIANLLHAGADYRLRNKKLSVGNLHRREVGSQYVSRPIPLEADWRVLISGFARSLVMSFLRLALVKRSSRSEVIGCILDH